MAHDYTYEEITKLVNACQSQTSALRERMDTDFDLWTLQPYEIPSDKGDYESYTSNQPKVLGDKVTEMLASSDIQFSIPLIDDTEAERNRISDTERFVYGTMEKADWWWTLDPHNPSLQSVISWYNTLRGYIVLRFQFYKDKDDIIPDCAAWDARNTYWGLGRRGLAWGCYKRWASQEQIDDEYNKKVAPDKQGRVEVWDWWDETYERVFVNKEQVHEQKHKLEKPPILILPVGATPVVTSDNQSDTIKYLGESVFAPDRDIFDKNSEMMSYYMTVVATGTRVPTVVYYKGAKPPKFEANPYLKGRTMFLSVDRGEKVEEFYKPSMPQDAAAALALVRGEVSMGGLPPIMYGEVNQQMPAKGMALLTYAGMGILNPRILAMERAYSWLANEMVRQYRNGDFGTIELEGFDKSKRPFAVKISANKLTEKRRIYAKLKAQMPKDDLENMGIAVQAKESKVLSLQTIQDKYLNVADTDLENEIIAREEGESLPEVKLMRWAAAAFANGRDDEAFFFLQLKERMAQTQVSTQPPEQKGVAPMAGSPRAMVPSSLVRGGQGMNVPTEVRQRMTENMRLNRMGMTRG